MATVFRPPLFTRIESPSPGAAINAEAGVWSNRLLNLYVAPAAPPGIPRDWPNPRGPAYPASLLGIQDYDVFQGSSSPTALYDWPNPRGPLYPSDLRTWLNSKVALVSIPPIALYDWPVPKGPLYPIDLRTFLDVLKLNLQGKDFRFPSTPNYEYPNPRGYVPGIALYTWTSFNPPSLSPPPVPMTTSWMPQTPIIVRGAARVRASGAAPAEKQPGT